MLCTITPSCCNSSLPFQESPNIFKPHPSPHLFTGSGLGGSWCQPPQWILHVPDIPSLPICKEVGTVLLPCSSQLPGSLLFLSQSLWPLLTLWLPHSLSKNYVYLKLSRVILGCLQPRILRVTIFIQKRQRSSSQSNFNPLDLGQSLVIL